MDKVNRVHLCNWCCDSDLSVTCSHRAKLLIIVHNDVSELYEIEDNEFSCVFYTCLGTHAASIMKKILKKTDNICERLCKTFQISIYEMKEYTFQKVKYNKPQNIPAYDKVFIDIIRNICFFGKGKSTDFLRNNNLELRNEFDKYPLFIHGQSKLDFYVLKVKDRIQKLEKLLYNYKGEKVILKKEGDLFFTHLVFYEEYIGSKLKIIEERLKLLQETKVFTDEEIARVPLIDRCSFLSTRRKAKNIHSEVIKKDKLQNLLEYIESVVQFSLPEVNKRTVYTTECCICMEDVDDEKKGGQLKCKHAFHNECIKKWFSKKTACPVCRSKCSNCLYKWVKV